MSVFHAAIVWVMPWIPGPHLCPAADEIAAPGYAPGGPRPCRAKSGGFNIAALPSGPAHLDLNGLRKIMANIR